MRPSPSVNSSKARTLGLAGLLAATLGCGGGGTSPEEAPPLVIVMIDTLRADRLEPYGYELDTSPVLAEFARSATVFEHNTSQANATLPSITSIMTGMYVRSHRNYLAVPLEGTSFENQDLRTLAERLRERGYRTLAVVSHPTWDGANPNLAVRRGWDEFSIIPRDLPPEELLSADYAAFTNERAFALLDAYEAEGGRRPLALWVHYFDPHTPYAPPVDRDRYLRHHLEAGGLDEFYDTLVALEPAERRPWIEANVAEQRQYKLLIANGRALYDAEIRYCDAQIGILFERLRRMGIYERALIAVVADHGENLEDLTDGHGRIAFGHRRLYEGVVRVPLMIKLPGQSEARRVSALSQSIDLMPTVMELFDLPAAPPVEGASLVPLLEGRAEAVHEVVFTESSDNVEKAVRGERLKVIEPGAGEVPLVFDLSEDPLELSDLGLEGTPREAEPLARALAAFRPQDSLHVRFHPGGGSSEFELTVEATKTRLAGFEAPEGARVELSEGQTRARVRVRVGDEPVEVSLDLNKRESPTHWTLEARPGAPLPPVFLGRQALERTTARPLYEVGDGPLPADPLLSLRFDRPAARMEVELGESDAERELLFGFATTGYGPRFELTEATNLENADPAGGRFGRDAGSLLQLRTLAPGPAAARIDYRAKRSVVHVLLRLDGEWVDPGRVVLDGQPVRRDRLSFLLDEPRLDEAVVATLLAGPASEVPPGAVQIWVESGSAQLEIDPEGMDPELLDQLRKLGYVR